MSGQSAYLFSGPCEPAMADRFLCAAQSCWDVESNSVILLPAEGSEDRHLRSQLQALGLETYLGGAGIETDTCPVIVIEAERWRCPETRRKVETLRRGIPDAPVCMLTGISASAQAMQHSSTQHFTDARALMQAAGFHFFQSEELVVIIQLDFERDQRAHHVKNSASSIQETREALFLDPRLLNDRLFSEFKTRSELMDLSQARVLLIGFEGKALTDMRNMVRTIGVSLCASCSDVAPLFDVVGMEEAFTHIIVNFDTFGSTDEAVVSLMAFRALTQDFVLIVVSANVAADDLTTERKAICDATLRAPLAVARLRDGLIAASVNYAAVLAVFR